MKPGNDQPGKSEMLTTVNRQAVELSKQLTHVSERCRAYQGNSITEQDVSEAFQNVEGFWEDLFPVERNRLIRLLVDKVEIRETGIDMELTRRWGQCRGIKAPGVWIQHCSSRLIPWYRSFKSTFTFGQR